MTDILVGEGHNGAAIAAKPGDTLVISLAENPTTGFRWSVTEAAAGLLQQQSDDFEPPAGTAAGAGGRRVLRYRVTGSGDGTVTLQLARPWEANAPRSEFRIRINAVR
jgi:inhibitor of cysteine peptidase